ALGLEHRVGLRFAEAEPRYEQLPHGPERHVPERDVKDEIIRGLDDGFRAHAAAIAVIGEREIEALDVALARISAAHHRDRGSQGPEEVVDVARREAHVREIELDEGGIALDEEG